MDFADQIVESLIEGDAAATQDIIKNSLATLAAERLQERKIEIAETYFGQ
jgi:hypothetical protein